MRQNLSWNPNNVLDKRFIEKIKFVSFAFYELRIVKIYWRDNSRLLTIRRLWIDARSVFYWKTRARHSNRFAMNCILLSAEAKTHLQSFIEIHRGLPLSSRGRRCWTRWLIKSRTTTAKHPSGDVLCQPTQKIQITKSLNSILMQFTIISAFFAASIVDERDKYLNHHFHNSRASGKLEQRELHWKSFFNFYSTDKHAFEIEQSCILAGSSPALRINIAELFSKFTLAEEKRGKALAMRNAALGWRKVAWREHPTKWIYREEGE